MAVRITPGCLFVCVNVLGRERPPWTLTGEGRICILRMIGRTAPGAVTFANGRGAGRQRSAGAVRLDWPAGRKPCAKRRLTTNPA